MKEALLSTTLRRFGATATAALAALVVTLAPSQANATDATPAPTNAAATAWAANFLATQLAVNGHFLNTPPSKWGVFPDVGNTIDAILALDGAAAGGTEAAAATTWVQGQAASYTSFIDNWTDPANPTTITMGGPLGKLAVLAVAQGADPDNFGGVHMVTELQALETPAGRFGSSATDFDVTINQVWAMLGLFRAGVAVPPSAVTYLAAQQCGDGGVRGTLEAEPCVSDPDATAFAAQAFLATGNTAAADKALTFLQDRQAADGSLVNASGEGANANTTGMAAQAFAAGGRSGPLAAATAFLRSLQWGCSAPEADRGGIAFTAATMAINADNVAAAVRATPQATLGLAGGSLLTVSHAGQAPGTTAMDCTVVPVIVPAVAPAAPEAAPVAAKPILAETGRDTAPQLALGGALVLSGLLLVTLRRSRSA